MSHSPDDSTIDLIKNCHEKEVYTDMLDKSYLTDDEYEQMMMESLITDDDGVMSALCAVSTDLSGVDIGQLDLQLCPLDGAT